MELWASQFFCLIYMLNFKAEQWNTLSFKASNLIVYINPSFTSLHFLLLRQCSYFPLWLLCHRKHNVLCVVYIIGCQRLHIQTYTIAVWLSKDVSVDKWQAGGAVSKVKLRKPPATLLLVFFSPLPKRDVLVLYSWEGSSERDYYCAAFFHIDKSV